MESISFKFISLYQVSNRRLVSSISLSFLNCKVGPISFLLCSVIAVLNEMTYEHNLALGSSISPWNLSQFHFFSHNLFQTASCTSWPGDRFSIDTFWKFLWKHYSFLLCIFHSHNIQLKYIATNINVIVIWKNWDFITVFVCLMPLNWQSATLYLF